VFLRGNSSSFADFLFFSRCMNELELTGIGRLDAARHGRLGREIGTETVESRPAARVFASGGLAIPSWHIVAFYGAADVGLGNARVRSKVNKPAVAAGKTRRTGVNRRAETARIQQHSIKYFACRDPFCRLD
jgi:hypothetical protein